MKQKTIKRNNSRLISSLIWQAAGATTCRQPMKYPFSKPDSETSGMIGTTARSTGIRTCCFSTKRANSGMARIKKRVSSRLLSSARISDAFSAGVGLVREATILDTALGSPICASVIRKTVVGMVSV